MRFVLDTNVIVKASRSPAGGSATLVRAVRDAKATMLVTPPLYFEYEQVIARPKHLTAAGATLVEANGFLDALARILTKVIVHFSLASAIV